MGASDELPHRRRHPTRLVQAPLGRSYLSARRLALNAHAPYGSRRSGTLLFVSDQAGDKMADEEAVVYIDRLYDDAEDTAQPWPRQRREAGELPWAASTGGTAKINAEGRFRTVEEAIPWGQQRAEIVLVRLGSDVEAYYSAGVRAGTWYTDGTGWRFPPWPPLRWPDYEGPPEPGWPSFFDDTPDC